METVRLRLDLGYDGAGFSGWSRQPDLRTVEGELGAALATIFRRGAEPADAPRLTVAGRTDAGVHATGQVAHLDLGVEEWESLARRDRRRGSLDRSPEGSLARRLNGIAGRAGDLVVLKVTAAPVGFDARFSPLWRRYQYRIADRGVARDPRLRGHTLWADESLDLEAMNAASDLLLGLHDFAAFCKPRPGATTIRTLLDFAWTRDDTGVLVGTVRADAFCHSMVRALVGAAMAVGTGRFDEDALRTVLQSAQRSGAAPVVAPHGLTLAEVGYPSDADLALRAGQTRARRGPVRSD